METKPIEVLEQMVACHPGERLPPERRLAETLGISRSDLRGLLARLRADGRIVSRQGSGNYAVGTGADLRRATLLIDDDLKIWDDPFFSRLIDCLQRSLQSRDIACAIRRIAQTPTPPDGPSVVAGMAAASLVDRHSGGDPPLIGLFVDRPLPPGRASLFLLDDRAAGRAAADLLIASGCTRLIFAGRADLPATRDRIAGARDSAGAMSVEVDLVPCSLNYAAGLSVGEKLGALPKATGVIAANDWLALGLAAALRSAPSRPPIVSFDGLPLVRDPALGIRSLAVPIEAIAADIVAELVRLSASPLAVGRRLVYDLDSRSEEA